MFFVSQTSQILIPIFHDTRFIAIFLQSQQDKCILNLPISIQINLAAHIADTNCP